MPTKGDVWSVMLFHAARILDQAEFFPELTPLSEGRSGKVERCHCRRAWMDVGFVARMSVIVRLCVRDKGGMVRLERRGPSSAGIL